jgi:hypothetical protein
MEQELNQLELKTRKSETSLAIVEMLKTLSWHLADKPFVFQKYIGTRRLKWFMLMLRDYQNLKGMVYQIWSLKLQLTPTSIGLLSDFTIIQDIRCG